MKLALTDLIEQMPRDDLASTRAFYASRPAGVVRVPCRNCLWCEHPGWLIPRRAGPLNTHSTIEGRSVSVRVVTPKDGDVNGVYLYLPGGVST